MKVTANPERTKQLIESLQVANAKKDSERQGIHCADLTLCNRQSAFKRIIPKAATETMLGYFVDGARRDYALKELFKGKIETKQFHDVYFTPDALDAEGCPVEFKTTRAKNDIPNHYVTQLKYYVALLGKLKGTLIIQRIAPGVKIPFESYELNITDPELVGILQEIDERRSNLQLALDIKSPETAMSVWTDKELNWLCRNCQWADECSKMIHAGVVKVEAPAE